MLELKTRPTSRDTARQCAPKGIRELPGHTEADRALAAIVALARREPQTVETQTALRDLIRKFNYRFSLDY